MADVTPPRAAALAAWLDLNPMAGADGDALREAAARATLVETDAGPRFESASFAELVEFISELPF